MFCGDVVDELLDQHGLAHPGATEQSDLTTSGIRGQQINDFNPGF